MGSTPFNNGVLPTSTPIHPLHDSGYFSSDKLPLDRKLDTLSPIKEISNFKKINKVAETPYIQFDPNEVARELDFSNSVDFSGNDSNELEGRENAFLSFHIHLSEEECETFSKSVPSNSDRQCCGAGFYQNIDIVDKAVSSDHTKNQFLNFKSPFKLKKKVDFFEGFEKRNLSYITTFLLSLLSDEDLCRISCVSKSWKKTVQRDVKANCRRKAFLKNKYSQKENQCHLTSSLRNDLGENGNPHSCEHKTVLYNRCNFPVNSKQPLKQKAATKFESFVKEGAQGNSILMKCPTCNYAAKNHIGNAYLCTKCNYAFCQQCLNPYLKNHTCFKATKVSVLIGSKRSKRNLKRL